ncbi:hypothetical protein HCN44_005464 [Aphidius gifuensis]|uniref:Nucleolar pre-ribosomal-associated protein 1 n=1 Tax=Aphidius gifuensis TaxID=684658 RepID=A0A835CV80_APHGI|nr:nucleolar pre-ribosomal-associated protein 1 [Aphidius gifuensis]KAF7997187.1 hypothetical protein HCN44_005464 [Aphidius gifuensis]
MTVVEVNKKRKLSENVVDNNNDDGDGDVVDDDKCIEKKSNNKKVKIDNAGSALEIIRSLDTIDKKNMSNVAEIFSKFQVAIMKILKNYPQYQIQAIEACRYLINYHLSSVHSMLSTQSNPGQRKIILRLLASIVSLGDNLPRELLNHISFHQETLDMLSQHTKPTDPGSVRTCFIHFIMSYLIDTDLQIVKTLLDKRGLLSSIFNDLIYDSHVTINLVLTTVKKYVLEMPGISKTIKLHVFSTPILQNLVSLYNWKGPKCWPGLRQKTKIEPPTTFEYSEEKSIAVDAVHDFLLVLLTSNKYGVIFNDKSLGTTGKKNNQLVNTILQSMDKPWEHEKPCELVIKILAACPDLIRSQLMYTEPYLEPRISKKWLAVMKFIRNIFDNINTNILETCLPELSMSQLISATCTLSMPNVVLQKSIIPSINNESIILRHEAIITLTIMLKKIKSFMDIAEKKLPTRADYLQYKTAINDYILKNMPNIEAILKTWNQAGETVDASKANEEIDDNLDPLKSIHYSCILDLLEAYHDVNPEFLNTELITDTTTTTNKIQPSTLLNFTDDIEDIDDEIINKMKIKAIKIVLYLNEEAFKPQEKLFNESIPFLVSILNHESQELNIEAKKILKMLFKTSKMFDECTDQIDIWINTFQLLENHEKQEVSIWLVNIIKKTSKKSDKYLNKITEIEQKIKLNTIPLILSSTLDSLTKKSNDSAVKYISFVTIFTLHCQIDPEALIKLCQDIENFPVNYINSWKNDSTPVAIDPPFANNCVLKFSKILMSNKDINIEENFNKQINLQTKQELRDLFRMTLFYLTQFIKREKLSSINIEKYKLAIIYLLDYSKIMETNINDSTIAFECSKLFINNPIIIDNFSPVKNSPNDSKIIVTNVIFDIFNKIQDINDKNNLQELFLLFKNKLIDELKIIIHKTVAGGRRLMKSIKLLEFIEILQLNNNDIFDLLKSIMSLYKETFIIQEKTSLSIMGKLAAKLIELLADRKINNVTIETNIIHKFCIQMSQLKINNEIDFSLWENCLIKFLTSYPGTIIKIDAKIFNSLISNKINSSTIKLISFLTGNNEKLIPVFINYAMNEKKIIQQSDLIFSVISSNLKYNWSKKFIKKIYKNYKDELISYFKFNEEENIKKWISMDNVKAISYVIDSCLKLDTFEDIKTFILTAGDKLESVDLVYIKLLRSLFEKSTKLTETSEETLKTLLQIFMKLAVSTLKKDSKNDEKLDIISNNLCDVVEMLKLNNKNYTFEDLNKHHLWPQFTRFSLKLGLKISKNDTKKQPSIIKSLTKVCDIAYTNKCENEYVKNLFEMTTSHSEFINLMLSSQIVKTHLLELLYVLVKKNHSIMNSTQLPLYLSAYNATLNESDQWILKILQHYENENIKFTNYKPYLFGEAAASHYSVKNEADSALWRQQQISTSQVLDLFNIETVKNTIENYPVKRSLIIDDIDTPNNIYDPAFYLPLLNYILDGSNVVACHKITQTGVLALVLASCGSESSDIRMAAFTVISRFYFHLEGTNSKEKYLWIRFIDSIRNGIVSFDNSLENIRLSCLVSTFLAKSALVLTQPSNPLYAPLNKFFMAKPALELNTIPEFLTLFHSSEIQHKLHRHWILEIIRDGMKTELDMEIALKCVIFRIICCFYNSILADPITKSLILQVIGASVKIPKAALMLTRGYGLLVWLDEARKQLSPRDIENKNLISNILALTS